MHLPGWKLGTETERQAFRKQDGKSVKSLQYLINQPGDDVRNKISERPMSGVFQVGRCTEKEKFFSINKFDPCYE